MPKGFVYILECSDGTLYTGSTIDLELRVNQHQIGKGANHTKKRLPVNLIFVQEFLKIEEAFNREKQIQGWSRKKKFALIGEDFNSLKKYSECQNDSHYKNVASTPLSHQKSTPLSDWKSNNAEAVDQNKFYSHGKLLVTGEYVVLDGALSLAVPSKLGQHLTIQPITDSKIIWTSITKEGKIWFESSLSINKGKITADKKNEISKQLTNILNAARKLNESFLKSNTGYKITTRLEFSRSWGLGSSSTLINNIALWANVDAYKLLEMTFSGSGYDIACAKNNSALTYQLKGDYKEINLVNFNPEFKQELFFIHLNKKQDSRKGISTYNLQKKEITNSISEISKITSKVLTCDNLKDFETLITEHEAIISDIIKIKPVKQSLFKDYDGAIKSLGAWGGDFILATGNLEAMNYFKNKGYKTILSFNDILL